MKFNSTFRFLMCCIKATNYRQPKFQSVNQLLMKPALQIQETIIIVESWTREST